MRVASEPVYILHKRPYRETSQIIEVFSRSHGRLSLMSKGSRGARSKLAGVLQPFRPLLLGWMGRGEMPLMQGVDAADARIPALKGDALISGMYINELMMHLLHRHDVYANLFTIYHNTLYALEDTRGLERVLREFEKNLLEEIGFGLNLKQDADSGDPLKPDMFYAYHVEHGPVAAAAGAAQPVVSGGCLLALASGKLQDAGHLAEVKRLMRHVISHHLGQRRLKSRELFRSRSGS